jgi:hypothetical protein
MASSIVAPLAYPREIWLCTMSGGVQIAWSIPDWLIIYGFTSRSGIFHWYGDVIITGEVCAQGLWAGRDLNRVTPVVTRDICCCGSWKVFKWPYVPYFCDISLLKTSEQIWISFSKRTLIEVLRKVFFVFCFFLKIFTRLLLHDLFPRGFGLE